ncbi:MAG: hypothetical protein IJW20_02090 [Clostridia bacterium]|nr:hypothetical protein [Clostridia bacterium]
MNRKIKFLIISIIIIAGIALGINYISNAAVFGDELVNIQDRVGDVVKTYTHSTTTTTTDALLNSINTNFTEMNKLGQGDPYPEDYIKNNVYTINGIFCVKHYKSLRFYYGQFMNVNHGGSYNLYYNASTNPTGKVVFDKDVAYGTDPVLKTSPTVWKTVYEAGTEGDCCHDPGTKTVYSNFNAIKIYSGNLHSINVHYQEYNNNHRIPYIISFNDNTGCVNSPSEEQNALWGFTGELQDSCWQHGSCHYLEEETLHKAGIAVEQYMNVEKPDHGTEPKVTHPRVGSSVEDRTQAGSAYYSYGDDDFSEVLANMEEGLKKELETQKIISDGIIRIGPFKMSDYAYAFSEHVAEYSNKDLEWPHVVAGIVGGSVTIDENEIPIVAREEGEEFIHTEDGTVLDGSGNVVADDKIGASIVYKDWYNQVPVVYEIEDDVRGDASREFKTTLNGKEAEILYKPIIDNNTEGVNAGEYEDGYGFTEPGSKQLVKGAAKATTEHLKVKIKDENGDYTVDYPFPLPNSVFYIEVPVSLCGSAESILTSITFTYRETESTGKGDVIISRASKSTIKFNKSEYSGGGDVITDATKCSTYSCTNRTGCCPWASHASSSTGGTQSCTHTWTCNTSGAPTESAHDCPKNHSIDGCGCSGKCSGHTRSTPCDCSLSANETCSKSHTESYECDGCICAGNHDCGSYCQCPGHSHSHTDLFLCVHGHSKCENGYWIVNNSDLTTEYGQPILIVSNEEPAKTEVREKLLESPFNVRVLERINTRMSIICVWHGWDAEFSRGSNVGEILEDNGFFDGKNKDILGDVNWGSNTIKAAELGDRIVYRIVVSHTDSVPMWIWVRIKYPESMKADDISSPEVYEDAPDAFYETRYEETYQNGGWFSALGSTTGSGDKIDVITPDAITVPGADRTANAKLYVLNGNGYAFFFEYTFTTDVGFSEKNGKTVANTPTVQLTSLDYKWKDAFSDPQDVSVNNIDFNRTQGSQDTWMGPVVTSIVQEDQEMLVKKYVVNLNKYIYNVDHKNTIGTDTTTVHNEDTRGYEFYNSDSTNKYSYDELVEIYEKQELLKKASPVYVEYGDRITYKIEIGNGKVTERDTVADFDYNVDEMFITLVDELPKKYSNLDIQIEAWGYTKYGTKITETQGDHFTMPNYPTEWDSDTAGPTIEFKDLLIPRNGVTTITVSFDIEEHEKGKIEENKTYVKPGSIVYDYNRGRAATPWNIRTSNVTDYTAAITEDFKVNVISSSDWYILNDYKIDIDKYLSSYKSEVHETNEDAARKLTDESPKINANGIENGLSAGNQIGNEDMQRMDLTYNQKINSPVPVEKSDKLIYSIKLENLANPTKNNKASIRGNKPATQVRVSKIKETMHTGLQYLDVHAYIYSDSGAMLRDVTAYVDHVDIGGNVHEFKLDHVADTLLESNEFIVFYVEVEVTESNMSLEKLFNHADLVTLSNINSPNDKNTDSPAEEARLVKTEPGVHTDVYDENTSNVETSSEFVKMKDLVISGKVWLDKDRDGQMEAEDYNLLSDEEKNRYDISNGEGGKSDIVVRLYKKDGTLVRTTLTDDDGLYTFSKSITVDENTDRNSMGDPEWCEDSFNATTSPDGNITYSPNESYQRIDKATGKDEYGNYTSSSNYIDYYIEYEYDGILYKSTEVYSTGKYPVAEDQGMTNLTGDGNFNDLYKTDSNAYEKKSERERFNQLYEYISYNSAFDINKANPSELKFEKDKHVSLLIEDKGRVVRSRSFINNKTDADNYLWLYDYQGTGATLPNTEYLKYINLGLELREEVDIALTKDVYKVKTTINGESMEYDFNQNPGLNGVSAGLGGGTKQLGEYANDFIVKKAYGLEIYEYDYKYRVDQYFADEVRNYKGIESELNIEVTYRITVDNKAISDADDVKDDGKDYVTDNKLKVKISEIMDVYETNFIELGARPNDEITIKTKDDNGYLVDTKIKTIEAWYFKEDVKGNYKVVNSTAIGEKPIYIETTTGGTHSKVPLTVSATSAFTDNQISYKDYGYNKLYITGMENEFILEDKDLDIYVKYTLDKDQTTIDVDVDTYEATTTSSSKILGSAQLGDAYGTYTQTITVNKITGKATMQRSLKINDPVTKKPRTYNRGIENIAQVNAYSVWYMDNKPASLVDRNSNVGNLGANGESPDNITEYDDTTYKTGVEIKLGVTTTTSGGGDYVIMGGQGQITTPTKIERIIEGKVWDDSRTTTLGSGNEIQYIGDGEYNRLRTKMADALMNENVKLNYDGFGTQVTEERDFPIRSVKAEFIEIVKMPDPSGTGERYYEQVLQQVTWEQVQNTRTERDGTYKLSGFIPGTYIVRFTYGDTATGTAEKDMQIFNGQDYKSTQYNPELSDNETDVDKILGIMEKAGKSDARDDERRRLQVNSYSEVMTNEKAEILKGIGNGTTLTPNTKLTSEERSDYAKILTDNTYMQAETVEFLVKAEKLTEKQQTFTRYLSLSNKLLGANEIFYSELQAIQKEERDARKFKISNVDFGIEYRPESEIRLVKEIEEVKLVTEDGNTLVDLFFITEGENENTTHKLDTEKSKGLELVQFITNTYTNELLNRLTNEKKQGFIFVQVDEDILQGCTVQIVYKFEAENNSEVDRIAVNLDEIRYKENPAAIELINTYPKVAAQAADDYTASGIAAKVIESDMYRTVVQDGVEVEYRLRPKTVVTEGLTPEQEKEAYFGRYVGYGYFTGKESNLDTVASLKFDKILDYVDVNLEYKQESEQSSTIDKFWTRVKTNDLKSLLYQVRTSTANPVAELQNGRGYEYKTLIVSVDDRIKDDTYSTRYSSFKINSPKDDNIRNNDLSRFLLPKITVETEAERDKAVATIKLPVSKVLAAETDKDNMSYENLAEIVQFTTLTGRRTNFATTIGNADIEKVAPNESIGTLEFVTAALESDTAATETVTLIPPTGLMKNRLAIVNVVEATSVGVGFIFVLGTIAVILIIIIAAILFVIRKYKKRRII